MRGDSETHIEPGKVPTEPRNCRYRQMGSQEDCWGSGVDLGVPVITSKWTPALVSPRRNQGSSGREANFRLVLLYHPIPEMGFFHRPFISFRALWCVSSPPATISFRWRSCAFMTLSAVVPWCAKSQGPPICLHVIDFMIARFPFEGLSVKRGRVCDLPDADKDPKVPGQL